MESTLQNPPLVAAKTIPRQSRLSTRLAPRSELLRVARSRQGAVGVVLRRGRSEVVDRKTNPAI